MNYYSYFFFLINKLIERDPHNVFKSQEVIHL